jgi:hypothetical protein
MGNIEDELRRQSALTAAMANSVDLTEHAGVSTSLRMSGGSTRTRTASLTIASGDTFQLAISTTGIGCLSTTS